jgi:uncharacterized membrane protein YdcZ (DUF606 family)
MGITSYLVTLVLGVFVGLMLPRYVHFDVRLKEGVNNPFVRGGKE